MKIFVNHAIFFAVGLLAYSGLLSADSSEFQLNAKCPPSFELVANNRCELRTLYQFYTSIQDRGVGGTHTALPPNREGFSPQQIDLGRYLFFDPILSGNRQVACATCHDPTQGFSDGRALSLGAHGDQADRSAPSLWNTAFLRSFFWDARASSLEQQATGPLYSKIEMDNTPDRLIASLLENEHYPVMFNQAFARRGLSIQTVYTALAAFQTSLISLNSRYDEYAHGNHKALNEQEIAGLNVFRSFVARCAECHTPPLFTNNQIAVIGTPEPNGRELDVGAEKTFGSTKLKGGFKVPSLRNIAQTAPYMHSGGFSNLRDVAEFYTKGRGHAVPEGVEMQLHWHIWEPDLQPHELDQIVAFLHTLSDEKFSPKIPSRLPSGLPLVGTQGLTVKPTLGNVGTALAK